MFDYGLINFVVLPNGVNKEIFYKKMNSSSNCKIMNLSCDDFIVMFVGAFEESKGIQILDQALIKMNNNKIKAIFVGDGSYSPTYKDIIFKGRLNQIKINEYLNISNVFVLPTIREGSSNSILEAMAVGLPIISSDKEFNDDFLDESNSLRIDSTSIDELIISLKKIMINPELAIKMSKQSLIKSSEFDLKNRSKKLMDILLVDSKT
jgi:glycosyltransferase involved in cell wall biosynthesis